MYAHVIKESTPLIYSISNPSLNSRLSELLEFLIVNNENH